MISVLLLGEEYKKNTLHDLSTINHHTPYAPQIRILLLELTYK